MNIPDEPNVYHPWHPDGATEPNKAFILDDPFIPVVPAHDLPRALAWTVARAFRLNPESGIILVQGYGIPPASGGGAVPVEAAVFDLTAITLEDEPENRTLNLNRQPPRAFGSAPGTPQICQPQGMILSVAVHHPDGGVAEGDFFTDLLVSGHAGDETALAAFTAGGWHRDAGWFRRQQSELSDLICEVLWDPTLERVDKLFWPKRQVAYLANGQIRRLLLGIARRHATPFLQLAEAIFHQMPHLIQHRIIRLRRLPTPLQWNHRLHPSPPHRRQYPVGVIPSIRQQILRINPLNQRLRWCAVGYCPRRDHHTNRHPVSVHRQAHLGIQHPLVRLMA